MPRNRRSFPQFIYYALVCLVAAGCHTQPPPAPTLQPACPDLVRNSVYYLADPEREGRGLGTAGIDEAANYISGYYAGLHLQPAPGLKGFFQPFDFTTVSGLAARRRP